MNATRVLVKSMPDFHNSGMKQQVFLVIDDSREIFVSFSIFGGKFPHPSWHPANSTHQLPKPWSPKWAEWRKRDYVECDVAAFPFLNKLDYQVPACDKPGNPRYNPKYALRTPCVCQHCGEKFYLYICMDCEKDITKQCRSCHSADPDSTRVRVTKCRKNAKGPNEKRTQNIHVMENTEPPLSIFEAWYLDGIDRAALDE